MKSVGAYSSLCAKTNLAAISKGRRGTPINCRRINLVKKLFCCSHVGCHDAIAMVREKSFLSGCIRMSRMPEPNLRTTRFPGVARRRQQSWFEVQPFFAYWRRSRQHGAYRTKKKLIFRFFRLQRPSSTSVDPNFSPSTDPTNVRGFAGKIHHHCRWPDSNRRGPVTTQRILSLLYSLAMAGKVTNT